MLLRCFALIAALALLVPGASAEEEWWMMRKDDEGKSQCGPPLEADGVVLTPGEILNRFEECKLLDETPSLDLKNVMVNCAGNLNQVFIFSKSKEGCEELAGRMNN